MTNEVKFDINYILQKYEKELSTIKYVFFKASKCERLIILFAGINRGRYNRISWYWNENEKWEKTSYLFIKDDSSHFYVGSKLKEDASRHNKLIEHIIAECGITSKQVFTVGGSMGGYAAIYYALSCNLKAAIAVHPQVTYKASRLHEFLQWERMIRECSEFFYDLDDLMLKKQKNYPMIYLEYGDYIADKSAGEALVLAMEKLNSGLIILNKTSVKEHVTLNPSKSMIESLIKYFESL